MKFGILSFILFIALLNSLSAQSTFQKAYGKFDDEFPTAIRQTSDGGFIVTAGLPMLMRLNGIGDTMWTRTFENCSAACVDETADHGFIVTGSYLQLVPTYIYDVSLIKFDGQGNIIWAKAIGDSDSDYPGFVSNTSDGGYIFTGNTFDPSIDIVSSFLVKIDNTGNFQWSKKISGGGVNLCASFAHELPGGGYILGGKLYKSPPYEESVFLVKTDNSGNIIWSNMYRDSAESSNTDGGIAQTSDGGILLSFSTAYTTSISQIRLVKTDNAGAVVWAKAYSHSDGLVGTSVSEIANQSIIIGAYKVPPTPFNQVDECIIIADSGGHPNSSIAYGGSNYEITKDVHQNSDGGYIINGYTSSFGAGHSDIYIIRTDSSGDSGCNQSNFILNEAIAQITDSALVLSCIPWMTPYSITMNEMDSALTVTTICLHDGIDENSIAGNVISSYPNPSTGEFEIQFQKPIDHGVIIVRNSIGEIVFSKHISTLLTEKINLNNQTSGIYFLQVYNGVKYLESKLVVIRN